MDATNTNTNLNGLIDKECFFFQFSTDLFCLIGEALGGTTS